MDYLMNCDIVQEPWTSRKLPWLYVVVTCTIHLVERKKVCRLGNCAALARIESIELRDVLRIGRGIRPKQCTDRDVRATVRL